MSCRVAVQRGYGAAASVSDEQIATFLDLARQGDEVTFKELARCLGVAADAVDELWKRTVTGVRREPLPIPDDEKEMIRSGNAQRIFKERR